VKLGKAIAYCIYDGHAFFYKTARTVRNWQVSTGDYAPRPLLQQEHKSILPEMKEWKVLGWPVEPGFYFTDDLDAARKRLLESGRSPKVTLYKGTSIVSLKYMCTQAVDGSKGLCVIRQSIDHEGEIEAWLQNLPREVSWNAERLPALTHKVLNELLKAERRSCPMEVRKAILSAQNHQCALCGGIFDDDIEWDHLNPLQQTCRLQETKFQAICASCHVEKTGLEGKQDRTLESTFSKPVWGSYVASPRPPALVLWSHDWGKEGEDTLELDVRRCRRNALAVSAHNFSVFSPLDSIFPAKEGVLADFSFVEITVGKKNTLSLIPYHGPGWYHRIAVEHMLHYGMITWANISWSLFATGQIPPNCLAEPLRIMEEAWGENKDMAKLSINQLIGLWATDSNQIYHVKTSNGGVDGLGAWAKRFVTFEGGQIYDYVFATQVLSNASMRPIHDRIMATEHVRIAQLLFNLQALKVPQRCIKCIKTDCVVVKGFPRKRKAAMMELAKITFSWIATIGSRRWTCPSFA